jgi:hypothetical protein
MIDSKIFLDPLVFANKHLSIYTGCIHYKNNKESTRDVIALTENILYGMALVSSLSKEKAEKGLAFLDRMFHFLTPNGFPIYLHDFPYVYNDRANVDILLALSYFLENYGKVIPTLSRNKIKEVKEKLVAILKDRPLKGMDKILFSTATFQDFKEDFEISCLEEYEKQTLCKLLKGEKVVLPWHKTLKVYTGPLDGVYYNEFLPAETLFSFLTEGKGDTKIALFTSVFPKNSWGDLIEFETYPRQDLFINHQKNALSIHFQEHSIFIKAEVDIKVEQNHIDIILDEFEEFEIYFSDYKMSKILIDKEKATGFYPENTIFFITEDMQVSVRFIAKCNFFGIIMKGNRPNQLLDCNKNFALFDHKILLRRTSAFFINV